MKKDPATIDAICDFIKAGLKSDNPDRVSQACSLAIAYMQMPQGMINSVDACVGSSCKESIEDIVNGLKIMPLSVSR